MTTGKNLSHRLKPIVLLLSAGLFVTIFSANAAEFADDERVGDAGDTDNLIFEGLQSFTEKQIRDALIVKPSYLLASHPQANRREFLTALQNKLLAGYQAAGFPDTAVDVQFDDRLQKVRASVSEGPYFKAGQIRVVGAKSISVPELTRWFTTRTDESETASGLNTPGKASRPEDPMWESGESVDFTSSWQTNAAAQVESCLADQGFFFPKSRVALQRNPASRTADLLITIQEEGPPGVIDQIKVTGQSLHSAKDITQFLGLRKGQRLTTARLVEARRKLRDCGRFWQFTVMPEYATDGDKVSSRNVNLVVAVKEMEGVPHLNKSLSPTQQALVRLCEWFERFPSGNEDLEVKLIGTNKIPFNIRAVVSAKHGLLVNSADLHGASPVSAGFEISAKTIQFAAWASGARIASSNDGSGNFFLRLLPNDDKDNTNRFNLSLGAGYSSETDSDKRQQNSPLKFEIQITRAALLDLEGRNGSSCRVERSELVVSNEGCILRADAKSGRLIRIDVSDEAGSAQVRSGKGIWNQASGDFEQRAASLTNIYVAGQGFTTFLGLVAAEALRLQLTTSMNSSVSAHERNRAVSALRKLLDPELLVFANRYFSGKETNSFSIPADDMDLAISQNSMLHFLSGYIFAVSKELFPRHSWPWTVAR